MFLRRQVHLGTAGILVALVLLGWPLVWDAILSGLLLAQVVNPLVPGPLTRITEAPERQSVTFSGGGRQMVAWLYTPTRSRSAAKSGPGVILVHGVNESGKDDERIVWLADLLARSGFIVLTPDFQGFKSLIVRTSDVEELVASIRYLAGRREDGAPGRVGLIAFSYGAGPTVIAAADLRVRDQVQFVVSFGGYYDLLDVITFVTTGHYEFGDIRGQVTPNQYTRWIFLRYNLALISSAHDRKILKEITDAKAKDPAVDAGSLSATLGPEGRAAYDLLVNRDPNRVARLVEALSPSIREQIRFLSPSRVIRDLRARLFIIHSDPDDFIPTTESLKMAAAVSPHGNIHLALLKAFNHVQPSFPKLSLDSFFRIYIPEGGKVFWLIFDLIRQRHQGVWG